MLSGDGGRVGSDPAAGEVPEGLRARQQTFHLTADHVTIMFIVLRLRLRLPATSIPHLLRCFGVSLPPNGANSDSGEPTCCLGGDLETSNCDLSLLVRLSILVKIQKDRLS